MAQQKKVLAVIILAALLGGGISPLSKIALKEFPPLSLMALRFLLAFIILLPFIYKSLPKTIKNWMMVGKTTIFATLNGILFIYGVKLTGATVSQLIYSLGTITVAIIAYFTLQEKLNPKQKIGIVIGLLGTIITVLLPVLTTNQLINIGALQGNLMILAGMISFSIFTVKAKKLQEVYSPLTMTGLMAITIAIVVGFLAIPEIINYEWIIHISLIGWISFAYLSIIIGTIFFWLLQYAIKHGSPTISSTTGYLQPVFTFLWASLLIGEKLSPGLIIGGGLTMIGAYLVTKTKS